MEREDILKGLVAILKEVVAALGEEVDEIDEMIRPIGGLRMFDSVVGVEVTAECIERFDLGEPTAVISLFEGKDKYGRPCALTVGQITDKIVKLQAAKGE